MKQHQRLAALGLACALLATACGGHETVESDTTDAPADTAATTAADSATTEPGRFGTMTEAVCGPGDASGATDQGVTDDSITVSALADPGNTIIPGLLQELHDASSAFVQWCNEAGGINGRKIELVLRDAKLVEGQAAIASACAEDFMMVGGGSGFDAPIAEPRVACGLPQIPAFLNDPVAQSAGLQIQSINPFYPDYVDTAPYNLLAKAYPDDIEKFAYLIPDIPTSGTPIQDRLLPLLESDFGYKVVYQNTTPAPPATVDNWRPYVEPAKDAGATIYEFRSTAEQTVPLMATMAEVGYTPKAVILQGNNYDAKLIANNPFLDQTATYIALAAHPYEDAKNNPPTQQFLDAMDAVVPGWSTKPAQLGVFSWSSWLLFALAAKECGSELTRDCVLANAKAVEEFDGGGLHAPTNPDPDAPQGPTCVVMVRATSSGFEMAPDVTRPTDGIYNCDPKNSTRAPR